MRTGDWMMIVSRVVLLSEAKFLQDIIRGDKIPGDKKPRDDKLTADVMSIVWKVAVQCDIKILLNIIRA